MRRAISEPEKPVMAESSSRPEMSCGLSPSSPNSRRAARSTAILVRRKRIMRFTVSVWVVWFQAAFRLLLYVYYWPLRRGAAVPLWRECCWCVVGRGGFLAEPDYCFYVVKPRFQVVFYCCGNQAIYCHKIAALRLPENQFLGFLSLNQPAINPAGQRFCRCRAVGRVFVPQFAAGGGIRPTRQ